MLVRDSSGMERLHKDKSGDARFRHPRHHNDSRDYFTTLRRPNMLVLDPLGTETST